MVYHDIATRAQVLTLKLIAQLDNDQIEALTGLKARTVNNIVSKALERGFDPTRVPAVILDKHVSDAPKTGRPSKQAGHKDAVPEKVRVDRFSREMTSADISADLGNAIPPMTVRKILRAAGTKKIRPKPTGKSGLTEKNED